MTLPTEMTVPDDMPHSAQIDATETAADAAHTPDDVAPAVVVPEAVAPEAVAPEAVAPELPDRADAPVSEIAERFLKVVLAHVPLDRIEELHLFSPLRQGGVETGIAVIAARVPVVVVEPAAAPELPFDAARITLVDVVIDESVAAEVIADAEVVAEHEAEVMAEFEGDADAEATPEGMTDVLDVDVIAEPIADDAADDAHDDAHDDALDDVAVIETAPVPRLRHTVYTARYRLVQKGPERGKWEADVVAEADAPLITVDLVVRGVQRRAGEESEIVRYSAPQLARALRVPYPTV